MLGFFHLSTFPSFLLPSFLPFFLFPLLPILYFLLHFQVLDTLAIYWPTYHRHLGSGRKPQLQQLQYGTETPTAQTSRHSGDIRHVQARSQVGTVLCYPGGCQVMLIY